MMAQCRAALLVFVVLSALTGMVYPLAMTAVAQVLFPGAARGSIKLVDGKAIGSALIGQPFADRKYFWGRPSATAPAYNAGASSGSNLGPTNPALREAVEARIAALRAADPENVAQPPVDLVTASASGLDPHISPAAALYQVQRVARERGRSPQEIRQLVERHTIGRTLGVLGEPRVNVLELNLALDGLE